MWLESVSAGMRTVEAMIRELSQNDLPVLVVAEHGSGKAAAAAVAQGLKEHVKDRIGKWKYPRWIEFRSELPKTATGKIQRFRLRDV